MSVKTVKAKINGQSYDLTYNGETQKWEATITAPSKSSYNQSGHYYPVELTATDDAGNATTINDKSPNFGENLQLIVKEKVAPVITVVYPTEGAFLTNNQPSFQWSISDDDSGVDESSIKINIDGSDITEGITKDTSENTCTCEYTHTEALSDGEHTVIFSAADHDGNIAAQKTVKFKVDTVAPTLTVSTPSDNLVTNEEEITVSGTTSDITSSPVTVTINGEQVTVGENGAFSKQITLEPGENTITVIAKDSAGKTTEVTRRVTLDTGAPEFQSVTITPNPVDGGKTFIISVSVTD